MREVNVDSTVDKYGVLVENNTVSGGYNTGIYTANSARNYIMRNNEVFNVGSNGIHTVGALRECGQ